MLDPIVEWVMDGVFMVMVLLIAVLGTFAAL